MINYFSTDCFSNVDFTKALELMGIQGGYKSAKQLRGVFSVRFTRYSDIQKKWITCCTFVSIKTLSLAKYMNTCDRAKKVIFQANDRGVFTTDSGHKTTVQNCTCPNFTGEFTTKFQLRINGTLVCKHQIALAKRVLGINKISEYLALRSA